MFACSLFVRFDTGPKRGHSIENIEPEGRAESCGKSGRKNSSKFQNPLIGIQGRRVPAYRNSQREIIDVSFQIG